MLFQIEKNISEYVTYTKIIEADSLEEAEAGNYTVIEELDGEPTGNQCGCSEREEISEYEPPREQNTSHTPSLSDEAILELAVSHLSTKIEQGEHTMDIVILGSVDFARAVLARAMGATNEVSSFVNEMSEVE